MGHLKTRSLVGALRIVRIDPNRVIPRFPCIPSGSSFHVQARKKKQNGALAGCVLASHFGLQQFIGLIAHWLRRCER